jgi:hypothetical protein
LCVDANDHVLVLNRQDVNKSELAAGAMAPPMLEFDSAGNLVHTWGDPKLIDPRLHSCPESSATTLPGSTSDFAKLVVNETAKWVKVIKFCGARAD